MFSIRALLGAKRMATNPNQYYADKFITAKRGKRPRTVETYRANLSRYILHVGDSWPPTPETVAGFIEHCQNTGLADGTVAAYFRAVRTWCNWLVKTGVLTDSPLVGISEPVVPRANVPKAPPEETLDLFFSRLETEIEFSLKTGRIQADWLKVRDFCAVSLMLGTGGRISEICALRLDDIAIDRRSVVFRYTKNGRARKLPFSKRVAGDLRLWFEVRSGLSIPAKINHCFASYHRGEWRNFTHWGLRHAITNRCAALGVDYFNPHSLRHAYAIRSLENGASLAELRDRLGHRSITTTDIYLIPAQVNYDEFDVAPR